MHKYRSFVRDYSGWSYAQYASKRICLFSHAIDLYFLHTHTPLLTGARTHTYTLLPRRSADTLQLETSGAKQLVALIHTPPRSLVKA